MDGSKDLSDGQCQYFFEMKDGHKVSCAKILIFC